MYLKQKFECDMKLLHGIVAFYNLRKSWVNPTVNLTITTKLMLIKC